MALSYTLSFDWFSLESSLPSLPAPHPCLFPSTPSIPLSTLISHAFYSPTHSPPSKPPPPPIWVPFSFLTSAPTHSHINTYRKIKVRI